MTPLFEISLIWWRFGTRSAVIIRQKQRYETYFLTYSMEQSLSREANRFAASQEIPRILRWPKVHCRIYKWPPCVLILSQINTANAPIPLSLNIIFPSMPGYSKSTLSLGFPHQTPVCTSPLPHTCYITHPSHSSRFDQSTNIWWGGQVIKLLII